jgi:integrase
MAKEPGYRLHKPSGQAIVRLGGRMFYLGPHGSDESKTKYAQLKAEWLVSKNAEKFVRSPDGPTIASVCLAYLDHAEVYYGPGKELEAMERAITPLSELYATLPAKAFGPLEFKAVRGWWLSRECQTVAGRCTRQYINTQMKRVVRVLKWAVGEAMVPPSVREAVKCVAPLKAGRSKAPEAPPVRPVIDSVIEKTLAELPAIVADMVRVQLLTGARPGEVCQLTPAMVDRSEDVWKITIAKHKNAYRGKTRTLYAGPQAQAVLAKYLLRGENDCLFRPCDTLAKQLLERSEQRTTPAKYGNRPGSNRVRKPKRQPGVQYLRHSYARAIERACDKAFPAPPEIKADDAKLKAWRVAHRWSPNQLRHTRATDIRKQFGLESASSVLGHSQLSTTLIYAEQDAERAIHVARQIG